MYEAQQTTLADADGRTYDAWAVTGTPFVRLGQQGEALARDEAERLNRIAAQSPAKSAYEPLELSEEDAAILSRVMNPTDPLGKSTRQSRAARRKDRDEQENREADQAPARVGGGEGRDDGEYLAQQESGDKPGEGSEREADPRPHLTPPAPQEIAAREAGYLAEVTRLRATVPDSAKRMTLARGKFPRLVTAAEQAALDVAGNARDAAVRRYRGNAANNRSQP